MATLAVELVHDGTIVGTRRLSGEIERCEELVARAAFVVSVLLDPFAAPAHPP